MGKKKEVEEQEYFHGFLDRPDLPLLLVETGDFLLRISEPTANGQRMPVISVVLDKALPNPDDRIRHVIVNKANGKYSIETIRFASIVELVEHYHGKQEPIKVTSSAMPAFLRTPVARQAWELCHDDITQSKKLGEGAFGEVWAGKLMLKSKRKVDVAIKIAKAEHMTREKIRELMKEARLMRHYDHPNVVKLYGVAIEQEPLMIVMELIDGGALDEHLRKYRGKVTIGEKTDQMVMGAAWGVEYLHSRLCIHRDLAARNCLYTHGTVKISDFGLSREGNVYQMTSAKRVPLRYLAPESLNTGVFSQKTDVFTFGILCWEIYADADEPYPGMNNADLPKLITDGYRMELHADTPQPVAELILKRIWDGDVETRWTMCQIARRLEEITGATPPPATRESNAQPKKKKRKDGTIEQTMERDPTQEGTVEQTVEETRSNMGARKKSIRKPTRKSLEAPKKKGGKSRIVKEVRK